MRTHTLTLKCNFLENCPEKNENRNDINLLFGMLLHTVLMVEEIITNDRTKKLFSNSNNIGTLALLIWYLITRQSKTYFTDMKNKEADISVSSPEVELHYYGLRPGCNTTQMALKTWQEVQSWNRTNCQRSGRPDRWSIKASLTSPRWVGNIDTFSWLLLARRSPHRGSDPHAPLHIF